MVRFDATPEGPGKVGLSELVDVLLECSGGEIVAFVVLAEAAGLVGATLRRSPAVGPVSLELPGLRDWLSFTTERSSERSLALLVGVAASKVPSEAAAFLRPLKTDTAGAGARARGALSVSSRTAGGTAIWEGRLRGTGHFAPKYRHASNG